MIFRASLPQLAHQNCSSSHFPLHMPPTLATAGGGRKAPGSAVGRSRVERIPLTPPRRRRPPAPLGGGGRAPRAGSRRPAARPRPAAGACGSLRGSLPGRGWRGGGVCLGDPAPAPRAACAAARESGVGREGDDDPAVPLAHPAPGGPTQTWLLGQATAGACSGWGEGGGGKRGCAVGRAVGGGGVNARPPLSAAAACRRGGRPTALAGQNGGRAGAGGGRKSRCTCN